MANRNWLDGYPPNTCTRAPRRVKFMTVHIVEIVALIVVDATPTRDWRLSSSFFFLLQNPIVKFFLLYRLVIFFLFDQEDLSLFDKIIYLFSKNNSKGIIRARKRSRLSLVILFSFFFSKSSSKILSTKNCRIVYVSSSKNFFFYTYIFFFQEFRGYNSYVKIQERKDSLKEDYVD